MRRLSIFLLCVLTQCGSRSGLSQRFEQSLAIRSNVPTLNLTDARSYQFGIVGDLHIGGGDTSRFRKILTQAQADGDAFLILLGDIVDKGIRSDMIAVQTALRDFGYDQKVLYVIGNHDVFDDGWTAFKELLGPTHFSITLANARFIALDTADGSVGKEQSDWLEHELSLRTEENVFLLSHYLPVVPGQRTYLKLADESEAARLMKVASRFRVSAWLGAHYHSFIKEKIEGVSYVVAGGGGGRRMEPVKDFFYVQVGVRGTALTFTEKKIETGG